MKKLLFHAIQPARHEPRQLDWEGFVHDAGLEPLPAEAEQLAPNVWLLPNDGNSYLALSKMGQRHSIATRLLPFVPASDWQPLSTPP